MTDLEKAISDLGKAIGGLQEAMARHDLGPVTGIEIDNPSGHMRLRASIASIKESQRHPEIIGVAIKLCSDGRHE
jgi:hypothetical protein